jgi:flagellin-like protein
MKKGIKLKNKKDAKGLSPIIATVILIVIVIAIALIVFFWVRGMTEEAITKFSNDRGAENIKLACQKVSFEATYTESTGLYISNPGNVPIFGMDVKVEGNGWHNTTDLRDPQYLWPTVGLNQGGVFVYEDFADVIGTGAEEITLVPILLGESESGRKTYVCDENQYGYKISVTN